MKSTLPVGPFRAVFAVVVVSHAVSAHDERPEILAPGWGILSYEAPAPGTYRLPPIMDAVDGRVLRETRPPRTCST